MDEQGAAPKRGVASIDASSVPSYALFVLDVLEHAGKQAFVVGGFVRDALRGVQPHDVDVATDALWHQTRDLFKDRGMRVVETGAKHGTVTVFVEGHPVEVTTFRTEGRYSDHRRPDSVRFVKNIEDDLARRDFTVNAMAWNPARGVVDPFDGSGDLGRRTVRAVGEPERRFEEDALRVIRGVRFAAQLGFDVEPVTARAIHNHACDLSRVASERVAVEYDKLVCAPSAADALRAFPDVAAQVVTPIASMVGFEQHSKWHCFDVWEHCLHALDSLEPEAGRIVRHVALLHDVGKPTCFSMGEDGRGHFYGHEEQGARIARHVFSDLHWRTSDIDRACTLIRLHDHHVDSSERGVRRMLSRLSRSFPGAGSCAPELFRELLQVKRADALAHAPSCVARRMREIDRVEETLRGVLESGAAFCLNDLAVDGGDVIACGIPRGPEVGRTLRALLRDVIEGDLPNQRPALLAAIKAMRDAGR